MTVIQASSAGVKDMADGSLRITFEFEPRHAKDAYALFGARGTSVAIAALKDGHETVKEPELKGGDLAKAAGMLDTNPRFREYAEWYGTTPRKLVLEKCGVSSRKELDHNPEAAGKFQALMREFKAWNEKQA
jgi:hypothetical protein